MTSLGWIVLTAVVLMIILINLSLWSAWRRRGKKGESTLDMLAKAGKGMKEPWQTQDAQIQELSRRIADLKENQPPPTDENIRQNQ